jgi:hypothetical protein
MGQNSHGLGRLKVRRHLDAQERAKNVASKRVHAHQPQAPGVYRPAGSAALDDVRALERQLGDARSDREALRLATRLTQARRAAGM